MGFNASKETGYPATDNGDQPAAQPAPAAPAKAFRSDKDRSIALQVGFKIAGPAVMALGSVSSIEDWLAKTIDTAHKIKEEILK